MEWWRHELYGVFDHIAFGFPYIRTKFTDSVRPVVVTDPANVGSSFFLENNVDNYCIIPDRLLVTARHCIESGSFKVPGTDELQNGDLEVSVHANKNVDVATIKFRSGLPIAQTRGFRLSIGKVLDDVLVMGFPPIPGFETVQLAEVSTIATSQKSTIGQISANERSYLGRQDYHLVSARTKGGSSGGPVINRSGLVVGVVTDAPSDGEKLDALGMGLATPSERIWEMLREPAKFSQSVPCAIAQGVIVLSSVV